jgi:hypothetical protein
MPAIGGHRTLKWLLDYSRGERMVSGFLSRPENKKATLASG